MAVKTLKTGSMEPEAFLQEAEIMKKFSHPHLVAMYAVCTDMEPFYIITEYMCNGALLDFLRKETEGGAKHQFDSLISIAAQVNFGTRNNLVDNWRVFSGGQWYGSPREERVDPQRSGC